MTQTRFSKDCLILSDVTKGFATGGKRITVLNEITYDFKPGVSYAITGVSGSGKSTLLHILAGFEPVDGGQVVWMGRPIEQCSDRELGAFRAQHLGFVFQFHYLIKELTVYDNIAVAGMIQAVAADKCSQQVNALLKRVGLSDKQYSLPHQLSGGQQQRVAVARALMGSPKFLIADEPTGNLDRKNGQQVVDLFLAEKERHGTGVIVATHDASVYDRMDVVLAVENGDIRVVR